MSLEEAISDSCIACMKIMEGSLLRLVKPDQKLMNLFGIEKISLRAQAKVDCVLCDSCCTQNSVDEKRDYLIDSTLT